MNVLGSSRLTETSAPCVRNSIDLGHRAMRVRPCRGRGTGRADGEQRAHALNPRPTQLHISHVAFRK